MKMTDAQIDFYLLLAALEEDWERQGISAMLLSALYYLYPDRYKVAYNNVLAGFCAQNSRKGEKALESMNRHISLYFKDFSPSNPKYKNKSLEKINKDDKLISNITRIAGDYYRTGMHSHYKALVKCYIQAMLKNGLNKKSLRKTLKDKGCSHGRFVDDFLS